MFYSNYKTIFVISYSCKYSLFNFYLHKTLVNIYNTIRERKINKEKKYSHTIQPNYLRPYQGYYFFAFFLIVFASFLMVFHYHQSSTDY